MRRLFLAALVAAVSFSGATSVRAQHSDIEFTYEAGQITLEGSESVYEGNFPTSGPFERFTDDPGFGSEVGEGLGVGPNDLIGYNVLDNLFYWDGTQFVSPGSTTITITNAVGPNTVVSGSSGVLLSDFSSPFANVIDQADGSGNIHAHVDFDLSSGAAIGAYGLIWSLSSDDPGISDSQRFGLFFNYGLTETIFEEGVDAFALIVEGAPVPEPSTITLALVGGIGVWVLRTRRRRLQGST